MKQEHKVVSPKHCTNSLPQQVSAQRLEFQDVHHAFINSRQEQSRPQEELLLKEKAL